MNQTELIEELKKRYPLFTYKVYNKTLVQVNMGNCSMCVSDLNAATINTLQIDHKRLEVQAQWESKYPYLHFYISSGDFKPHAVWVKRDNRDAEAISYIIQDDPPYMQDIMLQHYNLEAKKAVEPGHFFCTGCGEAKLQSEYAYFHFAGNYCKECKDADPKAYESAINENYD